MKEFEHLKINLEDLKKATNNFGTKVIGTGGFGKVFEGEITHYKGRSIVAIKRLSREFGQGDPEFLKEIMMLSRYTHKNLISLLGFCNEDGERILVYEHAFNGSLDRHLSSTVLTWTQRLKICLDVARGLAYLHDHKGTQQRVLHRDIKSANILLDDNWNAKLSDMGLSRIGLANQQHSFLFTNVVGTPGYCDPQYMETYTLTKESDIYSFGVVLFEVLCGRLCFNVTNGHLEILVPMWKQSYEQKKLDKIIFNQIMPPLAPASLETFSAIAFQCLHYSREQRPTMSLLVKKIEIALKFQEHHDMKLTNAVRTSQKSGYVYKLNSLLFEGKTAPSHEDAREARQGLVHLDGKVSFTMDDLLSASAEVVVRSTFDTLYKVTLPSGDQVVVYRLKKPCIRDQSQSEVELNLLGKIKHPNLLTVKAYNFDPNGDKLLVYDYMTKGNLAEFLHGKQIFYINIINLLSGKY